MTNTAIIWSNVQRIECSWICCLVKAGTSYTITSLPILHNGVLNILLNNICLGDITGCTPNFLLNELISTVTRFTISIVSLLGNFLNSVSH